MRCFMEKYGQRHEAKVAAGYHQLSETLLGLSPTSRKDDGSYEFVGSALSKIVDEEHQLRRGTAKDKTMLLLHHYSRITFFYTMSAFDDAEVERRKYAPLYALESSMHVALLWAYYIDALNCYAVARRRSSIKPHPLGLLQLARKYTGMISPLISVELESPMAGHMLLFLEAEKLYTDAVLSSRCLTKADPVIMEKYELAADMAETYEMYLPRALVLERSADYMKHVNINQNTNEWKKYMKRAYRAYLDYGATIKLQQLQEKYGDQVQFPLNGEPSQYVLQTKIQPHILSA